MNNKYSKKIMGLLFFRVFFLIAIRIVFLCMSKITIIIKNSDKFYQNSHDPDFSSLHFKVFLSNNYISSRHVVVKCHTYYSIVLFIPKFLYVNIIRLYLYNVT